jgi:hypothetical protein
MATLHKVPLRESNLGGALCDICFNTDFSYYFEHQEVYDDDHEETSKGPTRSVGHIRQHQGCPFCRLPFEAFSDNELFAAACDEDMIL